MRGHRPHLQVVQNPLVSQEGKPSRQHIFAKPGWTTSFSSVTIAVAVANRGGDLRCPIRCLRELSFAEQGPRTRPPADEFVMTRLPQLTDNTTFRPNYPHRTWRWACLEA